MLCEVCGKKEKPPSQGNNCQTQSYQPYSFRQTPQAAMCPALGDAPRLVWAGWDYPFLSPVISLWQWFSTQRVLTTPPPRHTHTGYWQCWEAFGVRVTGRVLLASSGWRSGMLHDLLQCQDSSPSQRTIWPQMSANEVEMQWFRNWRMTWLWTAKCDRNEVGEILESNFPP